MALHHQLAKLLGYDLIRQKRSHHRLELNLKKILELRNISVVLDIGANRGQFAQKLRETGFKGRIISCEPIPAEYERLQLISSNDQFWEVHPFAIGSKKGMLELNITENSTDFSSFLKPNEFSQSYYGEKISKLKKVEVEVHTISDLATAWKLSGERVFLKTDTQGFDLEVLNGCGAFLNSVEGILVELSFCPIYDNMPDASTMLSYLNERGFRPSGFFPVSRNKETLELIEMDGTFLRKSIK